MADFWAEIVALGIDRYTILLILFLPVVATIVGIARHFVGIKTLSIYAPIVLSYAFIELGFDRSTGNIDVWTGLRYGIFLFALVFVTATSIYRLTKNLRLAFYPKMSIIFTAVALSMLLTIVAAAYLGRDNFIHLNIFSLVLISAISERLVAIYAKTKFINALLVSLETLGLALFNFVLFSWSAFQDFLFDTPWFIIVIVLVNLYIGRYTSLRIREYWRFRELLNKDYSQTDGTASDSKK